MSDIPKSKFGVSVTQGTNPAFDEPNEVLISKFSQKTEGLAYKEQSSRPKPNVEDNTGLMSKTMQTTGAAAFSLIVATVIVSAGIFGYYKFSYSQIEPKGIKQNSEVAGIFTEDIISQVQQQVSVPNGETPNFFQVEDPEAAKANYPEAYRDIQKGDILLLYTEQAVLYRPSQKKVVSVITN